MSCQFLGKTNDNHVKLLESSISISFHCYVEIYFAGYGQSEVIGNSKELKSSKEIHMNPFRMRQFV